MDRKILLKIKTEITWPLQKRNTEGGYGKGQDDVSPCSIKNFQDFIYFNIFLSPGKEVLKKKNYMPSYQA